MADDAQDRRLPATARKISKARAEGQVVRSRDLGHLAAFGTVGALLVVLAPALTQWMRETLTAGLQFDAGTVGDGQAMVERLVTMAGRMLVVVVPLGVATALVAIAAGTLAGGWNLTFKPLQPRLEKLDPIAGFKRLFARQHLVDVLKACVLALLLGGIGATYLRRHLVDFPYLLAMPLPAALQGAGELVLGGLALMLLALGLFALIDVPLQRHLYQERLKMSHEEVKKEHKDVEGNTEAKAKIKSRMRALVTRTMLTRVPAADIVVMNPTHFAVALKYDEASMGAPRVIAKGADLLALRIRDTARSASVPVLQAPPLARALYAHCEVDQEIPAALFTAVAQVLAWVYQLRAAVAGGAPMPTEPDAIAVPEELDPAARPKAAPRGAGA